MKAVILCGGKGTRMSEVTQALPKPLAMIGDRPILWHIMKIYQYYGVDEFILLLDIKERKSKSIFSTTTGGITACSWICRQGNEAFRNSENWKITF